MNAAVNAAEKAPVDGRATRLRDHRRRQILIAAKEVFAELGYHNASVSTVIQRAGIARGTFYLYFTNKRKVFDSILSEALEELSDCVRPIRLDHDAPAPRAQLRENLMRVFSFLLEDRPLSLLLLNQGLTPDAESAERVAAFYDGVRDELQASLGHGIQMGLVRPCDTRFVAAALFGAIRGAVSLQLESGMRKPIEQMVDELLAFALTGVVVPNVWDR
jgi:AcrR family transcriptional regulator